jgi:hypothetical protein
MAWIPRDASSNSGPHSAGNRLAIVWSTIICISVAANVSAQSYFLNLPPRARDAPKASELKDRLAAMTLDEREQEILAQILSGNIPDHLRRLSFVQMMEVSSGRTNYFGYYVSPDYLCIGSDDDYLFTPLTPNTAQRIADALSCSLPTRKMVDQIYSAATLKLVPSPIPPSGEMTTVPVFYQHTAIVRNQLRALASPRGFGLIAGHKKDVVISARLATAPGKVAIFGWQKTNGVPIQALYLGHTDRWVDYSHGIRLVHNDVALNGSVTSIAALLRDPQLAGLISDEGVILEPRYPTNSLSLSAPRPSGNAPSNRVQQVSAPYEQRFQTNFHFQERSIAFRLNPEVNIEINFPLDGVTSSNRDITLVYYALPNGNTISQTIGRTLNPGDDWHFDIQHIGAQTRFLRAMLPEERFIVAYLENDLKSWPAWRKKYGDGLIPQILDAVRSFVPGREPKVVLSGHSGGGSLTFGFLNTVDQIPNGIERIAFLDSNYGYDTTLHHDEKLLRWLNQSDQHYLCVLSYNDAVALLDGKTFVSPEGGTWGRSHAMLRDFAPRLDLTTKKIDNLEITSALNGRVKFYLMQNPEKKVLHTAQVERNGFIQAMVSGTTNESRGYEYFAARAYSKWIDSN